MIKPNKFSGADNLMNVAMSFGFSINGAKKVRLYALLCVIAIVLPAAAADSDNAFECYDTCNIKCAPEEWRPLADQGDASAQYKMCLFHKIGQGEDQDFVERSDGHRNAST